MDMNLVEGLAAERGFKVTPLLLTKAPSGASIGTFLLRYPRYRLVETNTHCAFARNARSTRAVPTSTFLEEILNDPAGPLYIGKNKAGMSSVERLDDSLLLERQQARLYMIDVVRSLHRQGAHKQDVNNLLEPWMWTDQIITSTRAGLENFVHQRHHKDATPELEVLGKALEKGLLLMDRAPYTRWHIPFIREEEESFSLGHKLMISVGRCASLSYHSPGTKEIDPQRDMDRAYSRLYTQDPRHESPFEHQAVYSLYPNARFAKFNGWCPLRTLMGKAANGAHIDIQKHGSEYSLYVKTALGRIPIDEVGHVESWAIGAGADYWAFDETTAGTPI